MQFSEADYRDIQGLVRFGYGHLPEARFYLLEIADAAKAREWIRSVFEKITSAVAGEKPRCALQIAFTREGLCELGVPIEGFSPEFRIGMTERGRSRRLGDVGENDPQYWRWGAVGKPGPHVLIMLYGGKGGLDGWEKEVKGSLWGAAFKDIDQLTTILENDQEPFGFVDGVSQPRLNWDGKLPGRRQPPTTEYTNFSALGEFLLGHPNEYGYYTDRPLLDPKDDPAGMLPLAEDMPGKRDLGRNGTYLVLRDLSQNVSAFHDFVNEKTGHEPEKAHVLASAMAGRVPAEVHIIPPWPKDPPPWPQGKPPWNAPLAIDDPKTAIPPGGPVTPLSEQAIAGIGPKMMDIWLDQFTFKNDPDGTACPHGAHIRRANPRNADLPQGTRGIVNKLLRMLGFARQHPHEDVLSSTRFHRILRRGRRYDEGTKDGKKQEGLRFIALNANIARQFEFIQTSWLANPKFNSLDEDDPLLGTHPPFMMVGDDPQHPIEVRTDIFTRPQDNGLPWRVHGLGQFVKVNGGAYFFMPGLAALRYIARS